MATITGIEARRGLVDILVDGSVALRVRQVHFDRLPLSVGDDFDPDDYTNRMAAIQFSDGYETALTSLDACARTEREIRDSLRRRGYVPPVIDAIAERLRETGLIDDAGYARRMAELQSKKPVGRYAFKRKLRAKGISDSDAEAALESFDDDQQQAACLDAARKLARRYAELPGREARAKLSQALARRGFTWDAIEGAVDQLFE